MNKFPDFGKDLQRGFDVHGNCYDCAEFYDGCPAWRASRDFACRGYNRLPDVGIDGRHGQEFPPSRMGDRKEPRVRSATGAPVQAQVQPKNPPPRRRAQAPDHFRGIAQEAKATRRDDSESGATDPGVRAPATDPDTASTPAIETPWEDLPAGQPKQTRQQSPAGNPGPDGKRLCGCGCGTILRKRERCCAASRLKRREETMLRRRSGKQASTAVYDVSGVPFTGPGTLSTPCRSGAHN